MIAQPGEPHYSRLSVSVQWLARSYHLLKVLWTTGKMVWVVSGSVGSVVCVVTASMCLLGVNVVLLAICCNGQPARLSRHLVVAGWYCNNMARVL